MRMCRMHCVYIQICIIHTHNSHKGETAGTGSTTDTFVTLAGVLPRLRVGGLVPV